MRGHGLNSAPLHDPPTTAAHERSPYQPWATDQAQLSYDDLRAEAALHANLRAEAFHKAAHARSRKQGEIATYYAQQVSLMNSLYEVTCTVLCEENGVIYLVHG